MDTLNLRNYPLERVQEWMHAGIVTADQWEGYAHTWRTGAPRFSNELAAYAPHEFTTDGARAVAEELGCCKWGAIQ